MYVMGHLAPEAVALALERLPGKRLHACRFRTLLVNAVCWSSTLLSMTAETIDVTQINAPGQGDS